jgi:predicted RNA binding protein YcfA (HicA-like mRNA interferase family)
MSVKNITYGQVEHALIKLGFIIARTQGSHVIFEHIQRNGSVIMKHGSKKENVPIFMYAAIKRTIIEKGIASGDKLDQLIKEG